MCNSAGKKKSQLCSQEILIKGILELGGFGSWRKERGPPPSPQPMHSVLGSCMNPGQNSRGFEDAPTLAPWWNSSRTCSALLLHLPGLGTLERPWKLSWHQIHSLQKMDWDMLSKLKWTRLTVDFLQRVLIEPKDPESHKTIFKMSRTQYNIIQNLNNSQGKRQSTDGNISLPTINRTKRKTRKKYGRTEHTTILI